MNANELRLGNYIQDTNYPERVCRVFRLTQGNDFNITYHYDRVCECSYANERKESLQPIPLTEEWLIKFGFEYYLFTKADDDGIYRDKKIANKEYFKHPKLSEKIIFYLPYCNLNYYIGSTTIKYVHQLQNVFFALCDEELTIK